MPTSMRLFIITLSCVVMVKGLSLGELKDAFLALSSIFVDTKITSSQTNTSVTNNIGDIAAHYRNMKTMAEDRARKVRRRKIRDLQESKFIKHFNLTLAIEKGIEFQVEFCSMRCDGNSRDEDNEMTRQLIEPLCAECRCDNDCLEYGDCCDLSRRADVKADQRYSCFQTDASTAVYIIASCPERMITYDGSLSRHSASINLNEKSVDNLEVNNSLTSDSDSKCNSCLSVPESIHLITSGSTGLTYCNQHCLICNEDRSVEDYDLPWGRETACSEKSIGQWSQQENTSAGNDSIVDNMTRHLETQCKVTFQKPEGVSTRDCDNRAGNGAVDTCSLDLLGSQCNLSVEAIDQIEKLCRAYISPVYEDGVSYQNIFCYLCQGNVPSCPVQRKHHPFISLMDSGATLGLLTDLTEGDYYSDSDQAPTGRGASTNLVYTDLEDEQATLTCKDGYWKDTAKGSCLLVRCIPDRHVTGNTSTSETFCQLNDDQPPPELYKLNLVWYLPAEEDFPSFDSHLRYNHVSTIEEIRVNSKDNYHDNKHRRHIQMENPDRSLKSEHFARSEQPEIKKVSCKEPLNIWDFYESDTRSHEELRESDTRPHEELRESEKRLREELQLFNSERPARPFSAMTIPSSTNEETITQDELLTSFETFYKDYDKNDRLPRKYLDRVMEQYIGSALKAMGVVNFLFQVYHPQRVNDDLVYHPQRVNEDLVSEPGTDRMLNLGNKAKSSTTVLTESGARVAAVVYLVFNSVDNREVFESKILHNFVGVKTFNAGSGVVTVEQVLSSPEAVFVNTVQPVFISNTLAGDCCSIVPPEKMPELVSETLCWDESSTAIPFSAVTLCPHVIFNISDFNVSRNFELVRSDMNTSLHRSQYLRQGQTVSVCIHSLDSSYKQVSGLGKLSLLAPIEKILTLVALTLSLTCLLMTFMTYVLFPSLRSLPGKNNMILVCWLFAAQLLVMLNPLTPKHSSACTALGIVLHYAWLATLCWTCVCSYHMFHVFVVRRGAPTVHKSHKCYLIRYLLVSNTASAFVVVVVILSSLYRSGGENSGYGGRICYLSSSILVGVAFLLPLSLVLLLNCIFFAMTVCTISRIEDVKRQSGQERRNVHIYIRLSSLTGLCWLLALLAEIPGLQPLRCVSVLVNGCQGVTLFLSYVCNRRVTRMWCHLVRSKRSWLKILSRESNQQITMSSSL